ncbi:MAG TPA: LysR family transcriptional regulator [Kofleriaceae bacterium]|jgi:DNA-binding transcriptional LysR family regulator
MDLLTKMGTFVRVVEAGKISAAARQLRISAATVSKQLTVLEDELGTKLVARTTRSLSPTPAGRAYYERCLRILRDVEDAQAIGAGALGGVVRISIPVTFGLGSTVPILRALVAKHPELRLDIRLEDRIVDLVLEGVDIAIRVASTPPSTVDVVAHELFEWRRVLVAAPGYLRKRGTPKRPADLARHAALSHTIDVAAETWLLVNGEERERVRVDVRCSSNAGHALRDLALDGAGIAMLPPWFVREELDAGRLRVVLPGWGSAPVVVHALYRAQHRSEPRIREMVDELKAAYAAIAAETARLA